MAKYLKTKWYGIFLFDETGIKKTCLFPKNAEEIAYRLMEMRKGNILEEEKKMAEGAHVDDIRLKNIAHYKEKIPSLTTTAETYGYDMDLLQKASHILATKRVKEKMKSGRGIVQAIEAIDDIHRTTNITLERLREWCGYFFIEDIPEGKKLADYILNEWDTDDEEMHSLKNLANLLVVSYNTRETIEEYVKETMKNSAPNISTLLGETLGARLIASAKGLKRLATMPAGTIQVLGAERALFRHIREGAPSPKHGIIFQHEVINKAPKKMRGKIARSFAAKIAIAAKADVFTKRNIADELLKDFEERIKEIKEK
jgi:nucleolar protein 56